MVRIFAPVILVLITIVRSSEILRPRGVAISKASLYDPSRDFTCFNGQLTIPFKYVNDDYCDCADGSDEPGTSACPNGSFHCTNAGHRPLNIPSSRVNDGICDCCDSSDEYEYAQICSNYCSVLGEEARLAAQKRAETIKAGCELREQLSWKGKKLKEEKKERLSTLEHDKVEAETLKSEREAIKAEAEASESTVLEAYRLVEEEKKAQEAEETRKKEEQEAFEVFNLLDSNRDEKIQINELRARQTFDQNKDGVVSDDEIKFFMGDSEEMTWTAFLESGWQRMKPFFMLERGIFQPPSTEQTAESESAGTSGGEETAETGEQQESHSPDEQGQEEEWDDGEAEGEGEGEEEEESEEPGEEEPEQQQQEQQTEKQSAEENKPKYDEETQKIIDTANGARSEFEAAERAVRDVEREIRQLQEALNKDFGHEEEFAPLDGECFEFTDREYVYKLCPFDQVSQRPRSGGAETRLGAWKGWVGRENTYSTMLYDHGQSCWNGPQRSVHVDVSCGLDNVILSAFEPNRCEYVLHFTTPSACWPEEPQEPYPHDEL